MNRTQLSPELALRLCKAYAAEHSDIDPRQLEALWPANETVIASGQYVELVPAKRAGTESFLSSQIALLLEAVLLGVASNFVVDLLKYGVKRGLERLRSARRQRQALKRLGDLEEETTAIANSFLIWLVTDESRIKRLSINQNQPNGAISTPETTETAEINQEETTDPTEDEALGKKTDEGILADEPSDRHAAEVNDETSQP